MDVLSRSVVEIATGTALKQILLLHIENNVSRDDLANIVKALNVRVDNFLIDNTDEGKHLLPGATIYADVSEIRDSTLALVFGSITSADIMLFRSFPNLKIAKYSNKRFVSTNVETLLQTDAISIQQSLVELDQNSAFLRQYSKTGSKILEILSTLDLDNAGTFNFDEFDELLSNLKALRKKSLNEFITTCELIKNLIVLYASKDNVFTLRSKLEEHRNTKNLSEKELDVLHNVLTYDVVSSEYEKLLVLATEKNGNFEAVFDSLFETIQKFPQICKNFQKSEKSKLLVSTIQKLKIELALLGNKFVKQVLESRGKNFRLRYDTEQKQQTGGGKSYCLVHGAIGENIAANSLIENIYAFFLREKNNCESPDIGEQLFRENLSGFLRYLNDGNEVLTSDDQYETFKKALLDVVKVQETDTDVILQMFIDKKLVRVYTQQEFDDATISPEKISEVVYQFFRNDCNDDETLRGNLDGFLSELLGVDVKLPDINPQSFITKFDEIGKNNEEIIEILEKKGLSKYYVEKITLIRKEKDTFNFATFVDECLTTKKNS